jgi:hypothetical protein
MTMIHRSLDVESTGTHEELARYCFDKALELADTPGRSPADERRMLLMSQACLFHWARSTERDGRRMLMAHCQASRIQALVGDVAGAIRHAEAARVHGEGLAPVYVGHVHEALARAHALERHLAAGQVDTSRAEPSTATPV